MIAARRRLRVRRTLVALAGAVILAGGYALAARVLIHGPVNGHTLAISVGRSSGSAGELLDDLSDCVPMAAASAWSCEVDDREGSGGVTYLVRVGLDTSCWRATLTADGSEGGMPRHPSGCVHFWQWSLLTPSG
jgi:hypothetical protein